jgi:hypothetical protein
MIMTRFVGAAAFTTSLTLFASPGSAKGFYWYTPLPISAKPQDFDHHNFLFPARCSLCRRSVSTAWAKLAGMRRGPLACEPNQVSLRTTVR